MGIIAREEEVELLEEIYTSKKPEFLALYGRRRIGKTYLIRQFFSSKEAVFFNVTGSKNRKTKEQIKHFCQVIGDVFYRGAPLMPPKTWDDALRMLHTCFSQVAVDKKIVLFFDELPWMAVKNSMLLEAIDYYWNQYWSNDSRIKLIVCGSSASWIIRKIINNKGGLHNRITRKIQLEPLNLANTKKFLEEMDIFLSHRQLTQIYMLTGGVPYYLSNMEKGWSASKAIEKLAFSKKSLLLGEFDNLFSSLFDNGDIYSKIVSIVAEQRYGIGKRKLLETVGKESVGSTGVKRLDDLEQTGFIMSFTPLYHMKRGIYYRLIDEYTLFYFKWIKPIRTTLEKNGLESEACQALQITPEWNIWKGLAFETLCYKHVSQIRKALDLSPTAMASTWRYVPKKASLERGAQIDLLFDRMDDAITICEIKYSEEAFMLTKEYVETLQRKVDVFVSKTKTKKQIFIALIAANGVVNNFYANQIITHVVTLDDLFKS